MRRGAFRRIGGTIAVVMSLGLLATACGSVGEEEGGGGGGGSEGGGGKSVPNEIIGIEAGAGIMKAADKAVTDYGLDQRLRTSSTPAMLADLQTAYKAEEPIVVTLWKPHWAYADMKLKDLKDPKGAMGEAEKLQSVGRTGFSKDFPGVTEKLKQLKIDDATLSDLEQVALQQHDDPKAGVKKWLADNPDFKKKLAPDSSKDAKDQEIVIGLIPWDEDIVLTHALEQVLKEEGYKVTHQQLEPGPLFSGVAEGDIDLFLDAWLPTTHKTYFDQYGDKMEKYGVWYDKASLAITVPEYMKDVNSIEDLKSGS